MRKPLIGITPSCSDGKPELTLPIAYTESVETAGGIPLILPHTASPETAAAFAALCDGFLFSGGSDLDPALFGEAPWYALGPVSLMRDRTERCYWDAIRDTGKPILGICRGLQTVNVFRGGTLYQDLGSQFPRKDGVPLLPHAQSSARWEKTHEILAVPGSTVARAYGAERISVNSFHHQAIKEPGKGLLVCAESGDGIVEAVCGDAESFLLGVQWHPELYCDRYPPCRKIFDEFIRRAL